MALAESPSYPESELEGLITALNGVMASSVVLADNGRIDEIHVLADARIQPKQIVRNIESALSAGLGVTVDRRMISVAQVREGHEAGLEEEEAAAADAPAVEESPTPDDNVDDDVAAGRFVFIGYDARTQPDFEAACRVTIRRAGEVYSGSGTGPGTPLGRAQAAARAVFAALAMARRSHTLGLEGVSMVESHGRQFVLIAAHATAGRSSVPLTGIAALHRSPEEAAILASLQSTNRWNEFDG
jgi:hypothetical protein